MSRPVVIFANPIAGKGKAMNLAAALQQQLSASFHVEFFSLPARTVDLERIRALGELHAAVSIGGDGTLQGVTELLLKLTDNRPPPILVVPLGTANLVAKHLKLPWSKTRDVKEIAEAIEARKLSHIDLCLCNGKVFLAVAGVGFDAQVVHELSRIRRGPISKTSYLLPAVNTLRDYRFPRVSVKIDGELVFPEAPALVYVGNVREYGTGIPMLPHARSDDRLLDVCVLPTRNPVQAVSWLLHAVSDMHEKHADAVYLRGKSVRIESPKHVPIQLDGEAAGHTPAQIEVKDISIPFIVA
jgi:YegS/Rv2252/BmrU family lipid kinase